MFLSSRLISVLMAVTSLFNRSTSVKIDMGVLEPDGVGLGINPSMGIETEDDPCGDDDILELYRG